MKKDINIPKFDVNEESPTLPPFVEKVAGQIDWIQNIAFNFQHRDI